ncbi:MAG TPA: TonB-dependent receptor [Acidobacteriaceae bacterium]|nr:TonB-dependent receptor [Acidobacteriaceae bacterium]
MVAFTASAFAQIATTTLRGVVKDPSGAVVPGAKITLSSAATGQTYTATSGSAGEYSFLQILPARYDITVTAAGFGTQTKTAELLVNQPATIDFSLSIKATSQVVNVSAEAQTLNTTDASVGTAVNNAVIESLPSETRNVPDLLSLQPGVLYLPPTIQDSRSGAVNGGRSDQGNITMDGIDDNDQVNGYAFTGVLRETQDSIQEFRVTTANANADAGRSSGAQVSMVTKSGTNKFHGATYWYYRPTNTVSNDWFNKQAEELSNRPNIPGKFLRNIFGVDLGGPIVKDKLFFFGNYEGQRIAENAQVNQTVPTAAYQSGILTYVSGGLAHTLSPQQVSTLDAPCSSNGVCPWGPGPDPNALGYFQSMPAANGFTLGDGYNTGSYSFSSPHPQALNTTIGRIDWTLSQNQHIFVRGNLQKDTTDGAEQFPGQGPSSVLVDNTKGIIAGDTWTISPTMVNDLRYGYIRQGFSNRGVGSGDYTDFRFMSTATAETRTSITSVPVNNIVDNFSWSHGKHTIELGGNWRLVHQNHSSNTNSFNSASSNPYWLTGKPPSPALVGQPAVDQGFANSYGIAYANLIGDVPSVTDVYNYRITSPTAASLLGDGNFITRHFTSNEFEYFIQDTWRATPNLTITFGIRHTLLQTPWETSGQQVAPTIDTHTWYQKRESMALQGQVYEPDLTFAPNGPYYGKPGYWAKSKNNIAPRFAIAYSPNSKTSIRAGAGIYYDHYGESLVNIFDQEGSYGVSSAVTNPAGVMGYENAPRFTDRHTLPFNNGVAPQNASFPYLAPQYNFAITWGLDSKMKTPYTEAVDFSIQRQLPGGLTLETDYIGRWGRHLLQSLDLAEPVDYVDPSGGGDYYSNGTKLSKMVDQNGGDPNATVAPIKYFEDVFPFMANYDYQGESATQAIYTNEWAPYRAQYGATSALADLDFFCVYLTNTQCNNYQSKFWQDQFSSLYALSTIGMSYYNAAQVTLRHPMTHGLQFDVSYTFSKSIDMGSDAERNTEFTGTGSFSDILNTWKPYLNRGPSDFDVRSLITGDWIYKLPFGRGGSYLGGVNRFANIFIGGWQSSGIVRTSSGLPFSFFEPGWTTDWQIESYGVVTGKVKMRRHFDSHGEPQFFDNPDAINNGIATGGPVRLPYPGEAGQRNNFRGDGYFDIDSGLTKVWQLGNYGAVKFAWEVYNVTNTVRFDPASIGSGLTGGNLGVASALLTTPRRMQFSMRYSF